MPARHFLFLVSLQPTPCEVSVHARGASGSCGNRRARSSTIRSRPGNRWSKIPRLGSAGSGLAAKAVSAVGDWDTVLELIAASCVYTATETRAGPHRRFFADSGHVHDQLRRRGALPATDGRRFSFVLRLVLRSSSAHLPETGASRPTSTNRPTGTTRSCSRSWARTST